MQNGVLMSLLLGAGDESWLRVSYWCTLLKLALLIAGLTYALFGWLLSGRKET